MSVHKVIALFSFKRNEDAIFLNEVYMMPKLLQHTARLASLLFLVLAMLPAIAQRSGASLNGSVVDPTQAAIPNADVELVNNDTHVLRHTKTDTSGLYNFPEIEPGTYTLTATVPGMETLKRTNIIITTGVASQLTLNMRVGSAAESVTVQAGAQQVDTSDSSVSDLVNDKEVENLPLDDRSFSSLMRTEPGVTLANGQSAGNQGINTDTGGFVGGQRAFDQAYTVDGGNATPVVWPQPLWALVTNGGMSVDSILEFRVYTTNKPADAGGKSGSITAITTKSGTSQFHGNIFEYLRNTVLDATSYFSPTRQPYQQNQFGGSMGGPAWRSKNIFFFGNYEGFRSAQTLSKDITVPTAALLADIPGGPSYGYLQQIYADTFPAPFATTSNPLLGTAVAYYSNSIDKDMGVGRMDWNLNTKNQLTLRYMQVTGENGLGAVGAGGPIGSDSDEIWAGNNALVRLTTTLTSSLVNEVHTDYDRHNYNFSAGPPPAALITDGFAAAAATTTSLPAITVTGSGLATSGNPTFLPEKRHENSFEYADTLTWIRGKNTFTFGGQYLPQIADMVAVNTLNRSVTFSAIGTPGSPAPGTLLSGIFQTQLQALLPAGNDGVKGYHILTTALFAHDNWRITRKLTLDLGLRWTYSSPFFEVHGLMNNLFVENSSGQAEPGVKTNMSNIANSALFTTGKGLDYTKKEWTAFAPNVGFIYDVFGNGHTAVSGGLSMAYERPYMQYLYNVGSNIPYVTLSQVNLQTFGYFAQLGSAAAVSSPSLMTYDPSQSLPYVIYWNMQVQQQIGSGTVFSATYLGNRGDHLYQEFYPNGGSTYTTYHSARPNTNYGTVTEMAATAESIYNAMAIEVKHQFQGGFSAKVAYTWSKSLDDGSSAAVPTRENDPQLDYGVSDFDAQTAIGGNVVYALPFGRNEHFANCSSGVVCNIISGWQLSSIFSASSGQPFGVTSGIDNNQDGVTSDFAYQIGPLSGLNRVAGEGKTYFFNTANRAAVFAQTGTAANILQRNAFFGPAFYQIDGEARKSTRIFERLNATFLMDAINLANHANFASPVSGYSSASFGQLQSLVGHDTSRVYQAALRLDF